MGASAKKVSPATPIAAQGDEVSIMASTLLTANWQRSSIVSVAEARKIALIVDYDPAAAAGYPVIIPLVSMKYEEPAGGDDAWFKLTGTDGSIASGVLTGTVPTGADYTMTQPHGVVTMYELGLRLTAATGATDEYRAAIVLDVTAWRWFHFIVSEVGAAGTPGTVIASYTLAC